MELLKANDKVFYDDLSHSYTNQDGELLMGCTELLHKHNLAPDLSGIPDWRLKAAAEKGTKVHQYLQAYEAGEMVETSDLLDQYKQLHLRHLASELLVSDNELVASKIDMVYQAGENSVIIVDIKTSEKKNVRYVTWQTSLYRYLLERQCPGIKVADQYLLWTDKNFKGIRAFMRLDPIPDEEVEALLDAERNGLIYIDENAIPDITDALTESEAQALAENASRIAELEATLKALKEADDAIRGKLLDYMEDNNLTEIACPGGKFTRKAAYTQTRVDSKALESKFPAVYSKVLKTTSVKSSISYKPNK